MNYINQILSEIISTSESSDKKSVTGENIFNLFGIAAEEINKLNVLDFSPNKRFDYTMIRQKIRRLGVMGSYSGNDVKNFIPLCKELSEIMQYYGEYGSTILNRNFSYISNSVIKNIIERDYVELNNILIPSGAWKSAVILSGSILEALLYDLLEQPSYYNIAMQSQLAPRKNNTVIDIKQREWRLYDLIKVSADIELIPMSKANSIDEILRNFRNFVHPKVEIRNQFPCTEAEAFLAKGALDSICNHFDLNN